MTLRWPLLLFAALFFIPVLAPAQGVDARLSSKRVEVGEIFNYEIRANGNLMINNRPRTLSSTVKPISAGSMRSSFRVTTFRFQAVKEGPFRIEPFTVNHNGRRVQLPALEGVVVPVPKQTLASLGNIKRPTTGNTAWDTRFFTAVEIENSSPVQGEVFKVDTVLYWKPIQQADLNISPHAQVPFASGKQVINILSRDDYSEMTYRQKTAIVDGELWHRTVIATAPITALRSGETMISGAASRIDISRNAGGFGFSSIRLETLEIDAPETEIVIQPLPNIEEEVVDTIVGEMHVSMTATPNELQQGDLVKINVTVRGDGYLATTTLDSFPDIAGMEFVRDEIDYQRSLNGEKLDSKKSFDRIYVASEAGTIIIPPVKFGLFSPKQDKSEIVDLGPIEISVKPSKQSALTMGTVDETVPTEREGAVVLNEDEILYIDTELSQEPARSTVAVHPLFSTGSVVVHLSLGMSVLGFLVIVAFKRSREGDASAVLARQAEKRAQQCLNEAQSALASDTDRFYTSLAQTLNAVCTAVLGRETSGFTSEELADALRHAEVTEDTTKRIRKLLQNCDNMRYSPTSGDSQKTDDLEEVRSLMKAIRAEAG